MKKLLIAGASALFFSGLAAGAYAQETPKVEDKERVVIIERHHEHGDKAEGDARHKRTRIIRVGDGDAHADHLVLADCGDDKTEVDEESGGNKTRILLCGKGLSKEERLARLREIKSKLASRDGLEGEHRAKVEAALDRAIERVNSAD